MERSDIVKAIYENNDEWSCDICPTITENDNQKNVCLQCADKLLSDYEKQIKIIGYNDGARDMAKEKQAEIDGLMDKIKELKQKIISRPIELYAIEDCISGHIIFNARGGCYKDVSEAEDKIIRLLKEKGDKKYRIVTYRLQ